MAIYKGDKKIIALYKGDKKIIKRYKGTQVVYNYIPEDTGTTTYADDALVFEFTGDTLTYKLNNKTYTATTSPTIVNLSDLGLDANAYFMFDNLFYNQQNLTKVLHFPKVNGTTLIGYSIFRSCKNVEYIDLSNLGILKSLHFLFNGCTSLKNLILDDVDLSSYNYLNNNSAFRNVPNDIQISMNGCNCESIVTIKQALNDSGIVTYNNNVVTNNNCTFEPSETIEYNVNFYNINEWEKYDEELTADSIYITVTNYNEDGVSSYTESDISEEVSYEYEQIEEYGEDKIKCTIYYKGNNIYEKTYRGTLPNTDVECFVKGNEFKFEYDENSGLSNIVILKNKSTDGVALYTYNATTNPYTIKIDDPDVHVIQLNAIDVTKIYSLPDIKYSNLDSLMQHSGSCETFDFSCMDYSEAQETSLFRIPSACTTFIADDMKFKDDYFNGKDLYNMFNEASNLQYLSIKNWPTEQFKSCLLMFYYNKKLETIDVTGCKFSHITTHTSFFTSNNTALKTIILGKTTIEEYDWWYQRLKNAGIQNQVTIEYSIV